MLTGKRALITGGARGIGAGIASIAGLVASPALPAYAAAKAGGITLRQQT